MSNPVNATSNMMIMYNVLNLDIISLDQARHLHLGLQHRMQGRSHRQRHLAFQRFALADHQVTGIGMEPQIELPLAHERMSRGVEVAIARLRSTENYPP